MPYKDKDKARENAKKRQATYRKSFSPEEGRAKQLWYRYHITIKDYDKMYTSQEGKCKICGRHQSELNRPLVIDHDHSCCPARKSGSCCGKCIRGLLCTECNLILGYAHDNKSILERAIDYLA